MNIEKLIMVCMLCFVSWSSVYLGVSQPEPREFGRKHVVTGILKSPDFDLESVIDNKPFGEYYLSDKRNPFIPVRFTVVKDDSGNPTNVAEGNPDIKFLWKFPVKNPVVVTPEPEPDPPVFDNDDIPVVNIPNKPNPDEEPEKEKVKSAKDSGIPVALIGFAETGEAGARKAILSNRKTGEVFTVTEGQNLPSLDMQVITVTPFSIILKMKNGEKIEFVNDILKEAHQSNAKTE